MFEDCGRIDVAKEPADRKALYEQALRCLDREENLIHYRMSWGLQWNIGGLAALVVLQNSSLQQQTKAAIDLLTAGFGIVVSGIAFVAILAAHSQSWFVVNTLCAGLEVKNHYWDNEFIRPYGNPNSVHRIARWISKYLFLMIAALWVMLIIAVVREGISIGFEFAAAPG